MGRYSFISPIPVDVDVGEGNIPADDGDDSIEVTAGVEYSTLRLSNPEVGEGVGDGDKENAVVTAVVKYFTPCQLNPELGESVENIEDCSQAEVGDKCRDSPAEDGDDELGIKCILKYSAASGIPSANQFSLQLLVSQHCNRTCLLMEVLHTSCQLGLCIMFTQPALT